MNEELYAIVEISTKEIKFMVFNFFKSSMNVLFSSTQSGKFCDQGIVIEPKMVGKIINSMIKKANQMLVIQIKRVAINLPSNHLRIRQAQAVIELHKLNHQINHDDINELITNSKNLALNDDEVICLTRPYKYVINNTRKTPYPPIGQIARKVSVNSLIYTINSAIYDSHLQAIQSGRIESFSILLLPFAQGWGCASQKELDTGVIVIDWNYDHVEISIFVKETLYDFHYIEYGYKHLVDDLQYFLQCSYILADDYLKKIINIDNDFLENTTIYSKYDHHSRKYVEYNHHTLKTIVIKRIDEVIAKIKEHFNDILKSKNLPIIFVGEVTLI